MQFAEADLSREEVQSLSRFAPNFEAEYALSGEYKIISLAKTIELGGCTEKKIKRRQADSGFGAFGSIDPAQMDPRRYLEMRDRLEYEQRELQHRYDYETRYRMTHDGPVPDRPTKYNVPALAIAPPKAQGVELTSDGEGYHYTRGKWTHTVKPHWHTPFARGQAGNDLHVSNFKSKLPPVPREAREAAEDYDWTLLLWEADWEEEEQYLDPAIILPVWKDLYAVLYTWDLTKLELSALKKASGD